MKQENKIYIKEHNAIFDNPRVEEPNKRDYEVKIGSKEYLEDIQDNSGPTWRSIFQSNYRRAIEAYQKWRSSETKIVGDHTWVDLQEVKEGIDFNIYYFANGDEDHFYNYDAFINQFGKEASAGKVAMPKEKDNVTSQQQPSEPVEPLTATSGNSIGQMKEVERNKRLFLLLDKLIGQQDLESIMLLETMVKKDTPSMQHSFLVMTERNSIYQGILNNVQNVQECDATESEKSDTDGSQK